MSGAAKRREQHSHAQDEEPHGGAEPFRVQTLAVTMVNAPVAIKSGGGKGPFQGERWWEKGTT